MKKVFVDSDIFVRDLRYPHDLKTKINSAFLNKIKQKKIKAVTSIFNVLEVCGILSFNLSLDDLMALYAGFAQHYQIQILFPADKEGFLKSDIALIFKQIQNKQSLGDAQVAYVVNRFYNKLSEFVSWNANHFKDKLLVDTKTPEDFV